MRIGWLIVLVTALCIMGCKKKTEPTTAKTDPPKAGASPSGPAVHAPTGVVVNPGMGGGGSGGAVQAVRKAAMRAVSQHEMNNIRLFIDQFSLANNAMPSVDTVAQALRTEARSTYQLVEGGEIVLTGVRQREGIWAYTREPQSTAGYHLVIRNGNVEQMMPQELGRLLQQQGR